MLEAAMWVGANIIGIVITFVVAAVAIVGSIVAAEESSERKKNMQAGTHDYYGNKIDD